ncbi:hypothetical protein FMM05_00145 [Flavobacterium zepuense]|uniref:Uncharacterized protein n=1 Tax=Flavobacterium zepuense TaxID=2593302 RepID=A0A552V9F1_9FLAO|nr:hypothetical protein [Flavobacterium zepuense]TRW27096.1 hypothetical protein FMM05_00145 [Flavobacterium zepuense]
MKKLYKFLLILSLAAAWNHSAAQVTGFPAKDVLTLHKLLSDGTSPETIAGILAYYYNDPTINASNYKSKVQASSNIFLNNPIVLNKMANGVGPVLGTPTAAGSAILGANVTNYADGIAKFLISRGKKELSMAFFETMKKDLKKFPEVRYLFPRTVEIIDNIESHNIMTLLQELRDAFTKDIVNEAQNILSLSEMDAVKDCPNSDTDCQKRAAAIKTALQSKPLVVALNLIQNFVEGNTIITGFDKVINDPLICTATDEYTNYLKLTNILLSSLRTEKEGEGIFITENTLRTIFSSSEILNLYFGLVYQQYSKHPCYLNLKIGTADLATIFTNILTNHQKFLGTLSSLDNINVAYKALRVKITAGEKIETTYYASFVTTSLGAIGNIAESYAKVMNVTLPADLTLTIKNLETGRGLCIDIQQRNYPGIFNGCIKLINDNKIFVDQKAKEKTVKYLSFAANLASATTSDEVENVIESVALPPGSYSVKQKSSWNIALNGYIGYAADFNGGLYAHGFYAPVGLAFSKGLSSKGQWAITIFSSIIDVGGIVSYRLKDSETESLKQEVRLESIISPSAQLVIGIPKTPIAVSAGWRMSPKLFYSGGDTFESVPAKSVFNIGVLIDIPIFTFFNRTYN